MRNVLEVLKERGFIEATSGGEELVSKLEKPCKIYCGFDPTSDSLHLGNLVPMMGLAWFQRFGHTPVAIVGGATGMIGDPSGKSTERPPLDDETLRHNVKGIRKNLETLLASSDQPALILNNHDWMKEFSFLHFLRDIGKYFRLGPMLAKESVKTRLQSEEGLSFTEFSYQVLQGYDFLHLFDAYGVDIQLGGSDQWGNITAGTDLIRKVRGASAYGVTFPLLTRSDGQKFGKSEKGAIWLSPEKLSPYEFFQYLFRVSDADVIKLMRMLTFMEMEEIADYERQMLQPGYVPNTAQKRLAMEVTRLIHGEEALDKALKITQGVAPGAQASLDAASLNALAHEMPTFDLGLDEIDNVKLVDLLVKVNLQASKGEARRLISNGGVYCNNAQVSDSNTTLTSKDVLEGGFILLGVGKKHKALLRVKEKFLK